MIIKPTPKSVILIFMDSLSVKVKGSEGIQTGSLIVATEDTLIPEDPEMLCIVRADTSLFSVANKMLPDCKSTLSSLNESVYTSVNKPTCTMNIVKSEQSLPCY